MNTNEALRHARAIAMAVCLKNDTPPAEDVAWLMEAGCSVERMRRVGYDGVKLAAPDGRAWYVAAPRKRKPGKKQNAIAIPWGDVEKYERCEQILETAKDTGELEAAYEIAETMDGRTLYLEIFEGLEYTRVHLPEPAPAPVEDARTYHDEGPVPLECYALDLAPALKAEAKRAHDALAEWLGREHEGITVTRKNERACWWVSGDTKPRREELKALGFRWSGKRKAWYLRPQAA